MNRAYDVEEGRPWWKKRLIALASVVVAAVLSATSDTLIATVPVGATLEPRVDFGSGLAAAEDIGDNQGWCKKQGPSSCAGQSECSTRHRQDARDRCRGADALALLPLDAVPTDDHSGQERERPGECRERRDERTGQTDDDVAAVDVVGPADMLADAHVGAFHAGPCRRPGRHG